MLLAFDSETYPILPGLVAPPPVCYSFAYDPESPELVLAEEGLDRLEATLDDPTTVLLGHNIAFDLGVACAARPALVPKVFAAYAEGRVRDTQIRQELLDIAAGRIQDGGIAVFRNNEWVKADYSLAGLETLHLGIDRSAEKQSADAWRLRYAELVGVPLEEWPFAAKKYALEDASGPLLVYAGQTEAAAKAGLLVKGPPPGRDIIPSEIEQTRAAWALHLMRAWGVRTDPVAVAALKENIAREQDKAFKRLKRTGLLKTRRANKDEVAAGDVDFYEPPKKPGAKGHLGQPRPMKWVKDMAAIQAAVVRYFNGAPPKTETGRVSTEKDVLLRSGSRVLALMSEEGGFAKINSTYIPALETGVVVPINARFNVLVNSGRTSCSKPNLQNIPTGRRVGGVRECFVPRLGHVFVSVDYDTLELRALAQVCLDWFGASEMAASLKAGREDLHLEMAARMLRISYDEAYARKKEAVVKRARDCAKVANFGFPGGLGATTLVDYARKSYGVRLTETESYDLRNSWLESWPEMRLYFARISKWVGHSGEAVMKSACDGMVRGGLGYTDACNHPFQNRAAQGAKRALFAVAWEAYVDRKTALFGVRPEIFVHDEIISEVEYGLSYEARKAAHDAAFRKAEVMCAAMREVIPDIPITATPAMMTRWYKNAEAVYDTDGLLAPWAPSATT